MTEDSCHVTVARAVALTAVDINPTLTTVARSIRHHDEQLAQLFTQFALFSFLWELLQGEGGKILRMRISETTGAGVVLQITCPSNQQQQTSEGHNQHSITTF